MHNSFLSVVIIHWKVIGELFLEVSDIIDYNSNFMYKLTKEYDDKINVLYVQEKTEFQSIYAGEK